jgi:hypothetical protein
LGLPVRHTDGCRIRDRTACRSCSIRPRGDIAQQVEVLPRSASMVTLPAFDSVSTRDHLASHQAKVIELDAAAFLERAGERGP